MNTATTWPDGKSFAFTVFDDTDHSAVHLTSEVYALLADLGMATTKSVWPVRGTGAPRIGGLTCDDAEYLQWVFGLKERGFEIALHNVAPCTSTREEVIRGLDRFRELFGHDPASFSNHVGCHENIYWGPSRLSGLRSVLYAAYLLSQRESLNGARGHIEGDRLFWGDLCKSRIKYVRNFAFSGINTLNECPFMPYVDPEKPMVNYWFASTDGPSVASFNECISEQNQDLLEEQGGACIMYTHFAVGFQEHGKLNRQFRDLMTRLARRNGWFVPVHRLLDHLLSTNGAHVLTAKERSRLELHWLADRFLYKKKSPKRATGRPPLAVTPDTADA